MAATDATQSRDQRPERRDGAPGLPDHPGQRRSSGSYVGLTREIVNPISGERIIIRTSSAQSNGQLLAFDLYLPPGGHVPAGHRHPSQEERFTVVSGQMRFHLGRRTLLAHAGDTIAIPTGAAHWFGNPGPALAHAYVEIRPALRMEELFETTEALSQLTPRVAHPAPGSPGSLLRSARWIAHLAQVALEFQQEVATPFVPAPLARAALSLLSWPVRRPRRPTAHISRASRAPWGQRQ